MSNDIVLTIVCMYSCHKCGLHKVQLTVPARLLAQDIVHYTKSTAALLGADHERISPTCTERKLDVWMPINNNQAGGPVVR